MASGKFLAIWLLLAMPILAACEAQTPAPRVVAAANEDIQRNREEVRQRLASLTETEKKALALRRDACTATGLLPPNADEAAALNNDNLSLDIANIIGNAATLTDANLILDCVIGPLLTDDPQERFHQLQFRGHMVITLLARYAMFNYTGGVGPELQVSLSQLKNGPDDAALTLMHIETAERYLREHIKTVNPAAPDIVLTDGNIVPFRESERLHRVIAVLQVVIDAHRPSIDRTKGFVLNIIGAISGGPGAIRETLRQVGNGLKGAAVVRAFTDAYMRDAIDYWNDVRARSVTRKDWYLWDRKLKEACDRLAEFAGVSEHHCFAATQVMTAS